MLTLLAAVGAPRPRLRARGCPSRAHRRSPGRRAATLRRSPSHRWPRWS